MKKRLKIVLLLVAFSQMLLATCSSSSTVWQYKIQNSSSIEQFFLENSPCQKEFYAYLNREEKIYFDTVLYPNNLNQNAYKNRWRAMLSNDVEFFKTFTFFNNYFTKHHQKVSNKEFSCFQKQKGFASAVSQNNFYNELAKREMLHDVSYLYPLIRWAYAHNGVDMTLSRERVQKAEQTFGIRKGQVGDKEQFARFMALFDEEYTAVAGNLSTLIGIEPSKAYKLLVVLTYLESRGNVFAVSTTGAFGPTQLTLHYYMMYGEPNKPFSVKSSLIKLANKFVHYHRIGKSLNSSVIAYKSGSLTKCQDSRHSSDVDCRYFNDYKRYMRQMQNMKSKERISRHLTDKSYFSKAFRKLKRTKNPYDLKYYEPYQYAVLKGNTLRNRAKKSQYLNGSYFNSLGKMKRSEIYELQDRYGRKNIGVASDKKVCY